MTLSSADLPPVDVAFASVPNAREIDKLELRKIAQESDRAAVLQDPKAFPDLLKRVSFIAARHYRQLDMIAAARRVQLQIRKQQRVVRRALQEQGL